MEVSFPLDLPQLRCIHFIFTLLPINKVINASSNLYCTGEQDGCFFYFAMDDTVNDDDGKEAIYPHQIV